MESWNGEQSIPTTAACPPGLRPYVITVRLAIPVNVYLRGPKVWWKSAQLALTVAIPALQQQHLIYKKDTHTGWTKLEEQAKNIAHVSEEST